MYPKSEILFPHRAIRPLGLERGADWRELVNQVASQRDGNEDTLAFSLMMIRLCDCLNCDQSGCKASLGCVTCAQRVVGAQKASDLMLRQTSSRRARRSDSSWPQGRVDAPANGLRRPGHSPNPRTQPYCMRSQRREPLGSRPFASSCVPLQPTIATRPTEQSAPPVRLPSRCGSHNRSWSFPNRNSTGRLRNSRCGAHIPFSTCWANTDPSASRVATASGEWASA